jgi:hypothetical protein
MGRPWRWVVAFGIVLSAGSANAQVIDFESGGLKYQALTKDGLTIMVAQLPANVREYTVLQVAISNGGKATHVIRPEDFRFSPAAGTEMPAIPARTVVNSLVDRASKGDVIKLITAYENGIYGNNQYKATNGYEHRRQSALAEFTSTRIKAAAAASAIALVQTKLKPGQSTDGAVFYTLAGKPFGNGTLRIKVGASTFEFPMVALKQTSQSLSTIGRLIP